MNDRELMQQALEALTAYDGTNGASQRKRVLAALRERLTQWDALDRMAENARELGLNYEPVHSTQISKVWWDLHGDKLMAERIDPATIYQKPKMQPCAGRNCGSTNPNLHSAECFEDYEKATGMAQPEQEPVAWKLMPRDATDSMLKAMDECSTEGYDERLYAGHAASVYMAAWDEAPETIPKKKWVGLTEEEHTQIAINAGCMSADWVFYGAAIERKLREKNTHD